MNRSILSRLSPQHRPWEVSTHQQPHRGNILCAHPPLHRLCEASKDGLSLVQVLLASLAAGVALIAMVIKLAPVLALRLVLYLIVTRHRRTLRTAVRTVANTGAARTA